MIIIYNHLLVRVGQFSVKFIMYVVEMNGKFLSCWVICVHSNWGLERRVETHVGKERSGVCWGIHGIFEGELSKWKIIDPIVWLVGTKSSEIRLQHLIHFFWKTIRLWMIGCARCWLGSPECHKWSEQAGNKSGSLVQDYWLGKAMKSKDGDKERFCELRGICQLLNWNKVSCLSEVICHNPESLATRQLDNEVHSYWVPRSIRNLKWLKKAEGFVPRIFVVLTVVTGWAIWVNKLSHSRPRVIPGKQIQSPGVTGMTSKYWIMPRFHNIKSKGFWDEETILMEDKIVLDSTK